MLQRRCQRRVVTKRLNVQWLGSKPDAPSVFQVNNTDTVLRNRFDSPYKIDNFSLFRLVLKRCSDAKTQPEPLLLATEIFVIIVFIIIDTVFVV